MILKLRPETIGWGARRQPADVAIALYGFGFENRFRIRIISPSMTSR